MPSILEFPSRVAWAGLLLAGATAYGLLLARGFTIAVTPLACVAGIVTVFAACAVVYLRWRHDRRLCAMFMGLAYFAAIGMTVGVLAFAGAPYSGPLRDDAFMAFERALGIDWPRLAALMGSSEAVNHAWAFAYSSAFSQIVGALLLLPAFGQSDRLASYLKLIAITLTTTSLIACLWPAIGPIRAYGLPDDVTRHLGTMGTQHLDQFVALRDGRLKTFDLAHMEGLVTFPSFHTIMAILTAWALWPLRVAGPLAAVLGAITILATIPWGGHYVADILAGALIAVAAIILVTRRFGPSLAAARLAPMTAPAE